MFVKHHALKDETRMGLNLELSWSVVMSQSIGPQSWPAKPLIKLSGHGRMVLETKVGANLRDRCGLEGVSKTRSGDAW